MRCLNLLNTMLPALYLKPRQSADVSMLNPWLNDYRRLTANGSDTGKNNALKDNIGKLRKRVVILLAKVADLNRKLRDKEKELENRKADSNEVRKLREENAAREKRVIDLTQRLDKAGPTKAGVDQLQREAEACNELMRRDTYGSGDDGDASAELLDADDVLAFREPRDDFERRLVEEVKKLRKEINGGSNDELKAEVQGWLNKYLSLQDAIQKGEDVDKDNLLVVFQELVLAFAKLPDKLFKVANDLVYAMGIGLDTPTPEAIQLLGEANATALVKSASGPKESLQIAFQKIDKLPAAQRVDTSYKKLEEQREYAAENARKENARKEIFRARNEKNKYNAKVYKVWVNAWRSVERRVDGVPQGEVVRWQKYPVLRILASKKPFDQKKDWWNQLALFSLKEQELRGVSHVLFDSSIGYIVDLRDKVDKRIDDIESPMTLDELTKLPVWASGLETLFPEGESKEELKAEADRIRKEKLETKKKFKLNESVYMAWIDAWLAAKRNKERKFDDADVNKEWAEVKKRWRTTQALSVIVDKKIYDKPVTWWQEYKMLLNKVTTQELRAILYVLNGKQPDVVAEFYERVKSELKTRSPMNQDQLLALPKWAIGWDEESDEDEEEAEKEEEDLSNLPPFVKELRAKIKKVDEEKEAKPKITRKRPKKSKKTPPPPLAPPPLAPPPLAPPPLAPPPLAPPPLAPPPLAPPPLAPPPLAPPPRAPPPRAPPPRAPPPRAPPPRGLTDDEMKKKLVKELEKTQNEMNKKMEEFTRSWMPGIRRALFQA